MRVFIVLICIVLSPISLIAVPPLEASGQAGSDAAAPVAAQSDAQSDAQSAGADAEGDTTSYWMEKKMGYAQQILRSLATGDYDAIHKDAKQLRTLSRVEGFVRSRNPEYQVQLKIFERVCDELARQSEQENLSGVTMAFNQLTVSCVECHRSLRVTDGLPSDQNDTEGNSLETQR
ncbi:hypothetical protein FYK55_00135 [Roseiconus nitratireducens]|uniref:Cytochrome c n=1 Tax=Roseiconus nitratireducens TaxID=2605748 RepID=A0A5M6DH46_9BACT|nr:hypothetical protein [Roseiconus nitratireducens]KAA5546877.1 hypothetical protein FYK55_00135 [Roseiconus nitratireducens]